MKSTITKYGLIRFLSGLLAFLFIFQFIDNLIESTHVILSYACMFLLTLLVVPAIKNEKHQVNAGQISFKKAFSLCILICFCIALGVGFADYMFTAFIEPEFIQNHISKALETMEQNLTANEFITQKKDFLTQMETFGSSGMMALFMFINVMTIGLLVSLVSAITFKNK